MDAQGKHVYVCARSANSVLGFGLNSSNVPAGSAVTRVRVGPNSMAMTRGTPVQITSRFAYVDDLGSNTVQTCSIGATGALLTVKALYELERIGGKYALVTMCIGGGQGIAAVYERMH